MKAILSIFAIPLFLTSCGEKESSKQMQSTEVLGTKQSLQPIESILIEAFWRATDETMRENLKMQGQTSKLEEFLAEHQVGIYSYQPSIDPQIPSAATLHITIPEVKGAYYGFDLEYTASKWQIVDAYTQVGDKHFNYYKGKFLGKKSLQPYLEKYVSQALER